MATFEIETASADDVARIMAWANDEGWNPANTDALAFHVADPGGFLIGRLGRESVCCISVVRYGAGYGFLGYYIARPIVRGQGYGIQIWRAGMARLTAGGAGRNVGLDGVVAQQGNYAKSGFRLAWNNIRHEGTPPHVAPPAGVTLVDPRSLPFDRLAAYDRRFFPEARDAFLAAWIALPERKAFAAVKDGTIVGFAVMRSSAAASRIGPLYGDTPEIAASLVSALSTFAQGKPIAIDIVEINKAAPKLAADLGLKPSFEVARMYTGANPEVDYAGWYGVTSLELG